MYDINSGKAHPVTIGARYKLACDKAAVMAGALQIDEQEWASRVAAIDRAQKVAINIERREARARERVKQEQATADLKAAQAKPFSRFAVAQRRA